ncbi:phosphoesterase [bacterium]|nr:phosphoesterase [bacterium]
MRLHILSDLHIEFADFEPPATDADVVILAGDVHIGREGRKWIRRHFADRPVIYVLGNHEFYRHSLPELTEDLRRETEGSLIHLLENSSVEIDGFTFLGCTLWTDFAVSGNPVESRAAAENCMADYQLIRSSPAFCRIRALDTQRLHIASRQWLSSELGKHNPAKMVVVTHHGPCSRSIPPDHAGEALNGAFCSRLNTFVATSRIPLWVHGHTHHCVDYRLGETRVLANQRGYPDAFCKDFDPGLVLEL